MDEYRKIKTGNYEPNGMKGSDGFEYHNAVKKGSEVIPLQEVPNIPDRRTFGEKEDDEQAQRDYIYSKLRDYKFYEGGREGKQRATNFVHEVLKHTYRKCGADIQWIQGRVNDGITGKDLEKELYFKYRIRFSRHSLQEYAKDEFWKAGTYIYKEDELVTFVSMVFEMKHEILYAPNFFLVRTNVELPGGKGITQ